MWGRRLTVTDRADTPDSSAPRPRPERLVEVREQVPRVGVHGERPGLEQLLPAVAAGQQRDRRQVAPVGGLDVPDRVADDDRTPAADLVQRPVEQLRCRLGLLRVLAGRPGVRVLVGVQQVQRALGVLGDAGAGQHDVEPGLPDRDQQVLGAVEELRLPRDLVVLALPAVPQPVTVLVLDVVAGDRRDQPITTHPDRAVDRRHRHVPLEDRVEGARPRQGMVVVGVQEGAVDVEDGRVEGRHATRVPRPARVLHLVATLRRPGAPPATSPSGSRPCPTGTAAPGAPG